MKKPRIMVTTNVSPDDYHWIKRTAFEMGMSKSAFLRGAIRLLRQIIESEEVNLIPEKFYDNREEVLSSRD